MSLWNELQQQKYQTLRQGEDLYGIDFLIWEASYPSYCDAGCSAVEGRHVEFS